MSSPGPDRPGIVRRFVASDGYRLAFRYYQASQPKSTIVAIHGIQSHSGWYGYSSQRLADAGYSVYFPDRRGSGENGTARGHAPSAERLINDVRQFARFVKEESKTTPSLLGLSWGGKLALVSAAGSPELFANLALLYPGLCARIKPNWWQQRLLKLIATAPRSRKRVRIPGLTESLFTRQSEWQQFIRNDHLSLRYASLAFLHASVVLDERVEVASQTMCLPSLLMLAGRDQIIDNSATRNLVRHFAGSDHTIREYEDASHTLEFEPTRAAIFTDLIDWLDAHSSK